LAVVKEAHGLISMLPNIKQLHQLGSNFIVCCDDTMLFSTNISTELFEYATAFQSTGEKLKAMLLRNVDAIFDDESKEWLK